MKLSDDQRLDWLRLIRTDGVGPRTFRALVNRFGSAAAALDALPAIASKGGRTVVPLSRDEAAAELARVSRLGGRLIATGETGYPKGLAAADTAPPLIAVIGAEDILLRPMVAIVGSRNASSAGRRFTEMLARDLGEAGYAVVSGLARGIDTAAHRAGLATGTVAVLAGGLERIYPSENIALLEEIVARGGAALSEMPVGWEPRARDFPRRNRIVSGLSAGIVVVEAARRSGSLITARFALEQGREVFAVPGSPLDPRSEGTNDLLRQGATVCTGAADVIDALRAGAQRAIQPSLDIEESVPTESLWDELDLSDLGIDVAPPPAADLPGLSEVRAQVAFTAGPANGPDAAEALLRLLGPAPCSIDDLVRQTGLAPRAVQAALLDLELAGRLERVGGNQVALSS